jgi:cytochrome c biogenesis protein CcmG/thiol:disulfide interchange protein DsbE
VFPAVLIGIVVAGVVAVVLAATGDDGRSGRPGATVEVASDVSVEGAPLPDYPPSGRDPAVGKAAPTIRSVDFRGRRVTAGGATGSPYALVFLAHWCPHCQAEVPRLVSIGGGGRIQGVDVVGVATGTSRTSPNYPPSAWLDREGWDYAVVVDDDRASAANAYGLTGYPFMVFVDASGTVVGRISGEVSEDDLKAIFTALAEGRQLPLPGAGASSRS